MRLFSSGCACALALSFIMTTASNAAAISPVTPQSAGTLKLDIHRETLSNGLRVVVSVDHTSPTVAVNVVYDVGSRNEERGRSGFAHLFEHMMFEGSANVPRGQHFQLVTSHGGTLNGTTNEDRTNYFETMPQNELALALWLEADRMKSLDVSEKNLENQRAVVKEEYRMSYENTAYAMAGLRLDELVYQGYWPYEHSTIGSMQDLDNAQLPWVRAFHDSYYAPNNAILAIAGDVDFDAVMELVKAIFGGIPSGASIPKYDPAPLPPQTTPRDAVVEAVHAKLPAIMYGWAVPGAHESDHDALELAAALLTDGESSRLSRLLVRDKGLAVSVRAGVEGRRGPDEFSIVVKLAQGVPVAKIDKLIDDEIERLAKNAPTDAEMSKLRNRASSQFLFGLESNWSRAQTLAEFELFFGDANLINAELDRTLAVTKTEIQHAVKTYLTKARRSRVEVKPAEPSAAPSTHP